MLILRRKVGESFTISDDISVTIVSVDSSGNVNLGIDAPKDILILRSELKQAANANVDAAYTPAVADAVKQLDSLFKKNMQEKDK